MLKRCEDIIKSRCGNARYRKLLLILTFTYTSSVSVVLILNFSLRLFISINEKLLERLANFAKKAYFFQYSINYY